MNGASGWRAIDASRSLRIVRVELLGDEPAVVAACVASGRCATRLSIDDRRAGISRSVSIETRVPSASGTPPLGRARGFAGLLRSPNRALISFSIAARIEVADGDHRHQVGAVPVLVEADERVARRLLEDLGQPDREALRVARALEQHLAPACRTGACRAPRPSRHSSSTTPRSFSTSLGVERDVAGPVAQDVEALAR